MPFGLGNASGTFRHAIVFILSSAAEVFEEAEIPGFLVSAPQLPTTAPERLCECKNVFTPSVALPAD